MYANLTRTRATRHLVILVAVLGLLLTACAQDTEPAETADAATDAAADAATDAAADAATDAAADTAVEDATDETTDEAGAVSPTEGPTGEPAALTGSVFARPNEYLGTEVRIDSQVVTVVSDQAFTIADEDWGGAILHVTHQDVDQTVAEDDQVRVIGVVEEWDTGSVEDELGVELDDDVAAAYDGEHYIVANEITVLDAGSDDAAE